MHRHLIGNDFVPNLSFLKLKNDAVEFLISAYDKLQLKYNVLEVDLKNIIYYDFDKYKWIINEIVLCKFIEYISSFEDIEFIKHHKRFYDKKIHKFTKESRIELYGLCNKPDDVIQPEIKGWRERYYTHLFQTSKDVACKEYLQGVKFVVDYYFNKKCNTNWCYTNIYSPTMLDFYNYMMANNKVVNHIIMSDIMEEDEVYCTEIKQLLYILPKTSFYLLPKHLRSIPFVLEKGLMHYYPEKFKIQTYLNTYLHECTPLLPNINLHDFDSFT